MAEAPESVVRLVEPFDRNRDAYRSGGRDPIASRSAVRRVENMTYGQGSDMCIQMNTLGIPILAALAAAGLTHWFQVYRDRRRCARFVGNVARLCTEELHDIEHALKRDVDIRARTQGEREIKEAFFDETALNEGEAGLPLYDLITSNVDKLQRVSKVSETLKFFLHHRTAMANVRSRLEISRHNPETRAHPEGYLTEKTFDGLMKQLAKALAELTDLAGEKG